MIRAYTMIAVVLVMMSSLFSGESSDTASIKKPASIKHVLIASGGSRLENAVIKNLVDMLREKNCDITVIDIFDVPKMNPDSFGAMVLMNAVDKTSLKPEIQKFIDSYEKDISQIGQTVVIISLVSGEQWKGKESSVDAIAQASTAVKPKTIAMKLYKKIAAKLGLD